MTEDNIRAEVERTLTIRSLLQGERGPSGVKAGKADVRA